MRYLLSIAILALLASIASAQTIVNYRGLEIQSPAPTGAAGLRLQNNFRELADRIGPSNLTATTAPTTDDDVDEGYYAGSLWYDTVGGVLYWCADNTDGAAVWKDLSTAGGAAAISDAAYAASWDGVTTVAPSKNAVYDYLSGLSSVYQAADADLTTWAGVTSSANGRSFVSAADYSAMKTLLAYGTMADQNANNVAITGGTINGTTLDMPGQFVPHTSNPVLSPTGDETGVAFGSVVYVSGTYYMYYSRYEGGKGYVDRATSTDCKTWVRDADNNPMLSPGVDGTWDDTQVDVPWVWREDSTHWYMIYRGIGSLETVLGFEDQVGLATSSDGITWTKSASNPVITYGEVGTWNRKGAEAWAVIKVGSTYYLWFEAMQWNGTVQVRKVGLATSTDLVTWSQDAANPIFTDHQFCPDVFKYGGYYYMLLPHYSRNTATYAPNDFTEFQIWRDDAPTFYADEREFLGVIHSTGAYGQWNGVESDTPHVICDDITRDSFAATGNELWLMYSGYGTSWGIGLSKSTRINGGWQTAPFALKNLTNVCISSPADNETLSYDATLGLWINQTSTEAGLAASDHTHSGVYQPLDADLTAIAGISGVNGDVIIRSGDTWARLAKGDDGQVLKLASGLPSWSADTDTNTTYSAGDGLELTGTDFNLDLKTGGGMEIDTGQLTVTAPLLIGEIGLSWHGTAAEVIDDAVVCPYSGTITSVIITANASGNIELDVWKSASGVPTVADTICNASYPALSAAQQDKAISVAGWSSTAITAGDTIKFEVRSVATITQATVQLVIAK